MPINSYLFAIINHQHRNPMTWKCTEVPLILVKAVASASTRIDGEGCWLRWHEVVEEIAIYRLHAEDVALHPGDDYSARFGWAKYIFWMGPNHTMDPNRFLARCQQGRGCQFSRRCNRLVIWGWDHVGQGRIIIVAFPHFCYPQGTLMLAVLPQVTLGAFRTRKWSFKNIINQVPACTVTATMNHHILVGGFQPFLSISHALPTNSFINLNCNWGSRSHSQYWSSSTVFSYGFVKHYHH